MGGNWVISMGSYKGGRLWIECRKGRHPPPNVPNSPLRGEYHDTRHRKHHAMEQSTIGNCISVVYFTPFRLHALEHDHWDHLDRMGFPCKYLAKIYHNFQLSHVCCNAWLKDLHDAVPEAKSLRERCRKRML
eukprot:3659147-Amphidinium_carterae.1